MPFFDLSCHHTSRTSLNASLLQWTAILHLPMRVHILMVHSTYLHIDTVIHMNLAAKNGGTPHLAVATEQGSIHILDTSKRVDWDVGEPHVALLSPHRLKFYSRADTYNSPTASQWYIQRKMESLRYSPSDLLRGPIHTNYMRRDRHYHPCATGA
jgi:hypothetical protein